MTRRQVPRWSDLQPMIGVRRPSLDLTGARLARAVTIEDMVRLARRRAPRAVFDYVDGAAESETSLARARETFERLEFRPQILQDVSALSTETQILGRPSALPVSFAPTGFTRLMHQEGEVAVARVAQRRGIPYAVSTLGTSTPEAVASAAPDARLWFQLYVWRDRKAAEDLMARAGAAGYEALVLTVDVPVAGARHRDSRNGLSVPPALSVRTLADIARHPAWWVDVLTTEAIDFAALTGWDGTIGEKLNALFDPSMTLADLDWIRAHWSKPLIVKGIQTVEDARAVVAAGADAVVLSNHGGRQLDRAPVPVRLLPEVRQALGTDTEIIVDSGIRSGADIVAALALGADSTLVGRAYLYGLMAAGERGVNRVVEILTGEIRRTMALLGASSVTDLSERHVRMP
ncbi:MAG TPA: alpha-hydroxy acid oxidase [Dermatophilaceae bacterium]|nr:alpha-hydroxy acid oxidase [Dermatophilaceae bacterium]